VVASRISQDRLPALHWAPRTAGERVTLWRKAAGHGIRPVGALLLIMHKHFFYYYYIILIYIYGYTESQQQCTAESDTNRDTFRAADLNPTPAKRNSTYAVRMYARVLVPPNLYVHAYIQLPPTAKQTQLHSRQAPSKPRVNPSP